MVFSPPIAYEKSIKGKITLSQYLQRRLKRRMAILGTQKNVGSTTEFFRFEATQKLDRRRRSRLGQYMTPGPISRFMASMFENLEGSLRVLDPGAGVGSLTAAFTDHILELDERPRNVSLVAYEIDPVLIDYLLATIDESVSYCVASGIPASGKVRPDDFIQVYSEYLRPGLFSGFDINDAQYTHVIMNPPYGKIQSDSATGVALRHAEIKVPNLYSAFLLIAAQLLDQGGEIVAIVPRSFCNGTYFKTFRKRFFETMVIKAIHVFNQRASAFSDDDVLQENVIIHAVRSSAPTTVKISSSDGGDFFFDLESGRWITEDITERFVSNSTVLHPDDLSHLVHIEATGSDHVATDQINRFPASLAEIGVEVSTGPVVDFRLQSELRLEPGARTAPLLYPTHFNDGNLEWPKETKKPNAIQVNEKSRRWLWTNHGHYVVTRRFSSKEERRRIVASVYHSDLPGDLIGFENHLNVYHCSKNGLNKSLAIGLCNYLNSGLLDRYFRVFSGHTQVNAADLRTIPYPTREMLERIGRQAGDWRLTQREIDDIIGAQLPGMQDQSNPVAAQEKIDQAIEILKVLGLPREIVNSRSTLTLLALLDLKPLDPWDDLKRPLMGITPIMEFCREYYRSDYAPNTRKTFRRHTMHQFVEAGIALYNPDEPDRPVNSPHSCYQISDDVALLLRSFGSESWDANVDRYVDQHKSLTEIWRRDRQMRMVPVQIEPSLSINLTPGAHSTLIQKVITQFAPRFVPNAEVVYVGDTGDRTAYFSRQILDEIGVALNLQGKLPNIILYYRVRDWLLLIEAVTSHGLVNPKRHSELADIFSTSTAGIVYVTAFPSRTLMARFLNDISWETEVWCAYTPSHLIHFDGDSFLGPFQD